MIALVRTVRVIAFIALAVLLGPALIPVLRGQVTLTQAMGALITPSTLTLAVVVLLATVVISLFPKLVRLAALTAVALVVLVITGQITPAQVVGAVDLRAANERISELATSCGWEIQRIDETDAAHVRAVFTDPAAGQAVVSTAVANAEGIVSSTAADGQPRCAAATSGAQASG